MSAPDQFVRQQALDIRRSFIVQAPAGSGKTELLIQRYLALLATVDEPEEVLAITFTRKAVAEMRKRVIEALNGAQQARPESEHAALTWQLAVDVLRRSEERHWNLTVQPARMRIMTIDSLNASLVGSMPWLSRIGSDAAMQDNAQSLYEEAAWQILDSRNAALPSQAEALQTLLLHLDNNDRRVMRLLCGLLAKRDQWLRYLVPLKSGQVDADTRGSLTQMFVEVIEEQLADLHAHIPFDIGHEMVRIAAAGAGQLWAQGITDKALLACRELAELPEPRIEMISQWKGLASLFLTTQGSWRSARSFNKTLGFPPGNEYKPAIEQLQKKLQDHEEILIKYKDIVELPETVYSDSQWDVLAALIELLPVAVAQLQLVFQQHGAMDFVAQAMAADHALGQGDQVTDLAMKLDVQLMHILMDEFQDTSYSQFRLLEKLLDGWQPDDGRSLFLVGDPMQSIYGFREADVSGFLKVRDHGIGTMQPESLALNANFRSTPQLVDWFNTVFPDVLASEDNLSLGAVRYTGAVAARQATPDSSVRVHAGLDLERDAQARDMLAVIQQTVEQYPGQNIGVLVRSRGHLHDLYQLLTDSGMEFQAVDILPINKQPVIHDLLSVTRSLLHLHDRVAWLAVLRAPWCGLTLRSLHTLTGNYPGDDLWSLMNNPEIQCQLDDSELARLQRMIDCYTAVLDHSSQLTLRTRIEWLWRGLGGVDCHVGTEHDMQTYLNVIDELELGGQDVTPNAIITALADVYTSNVSSHQGADASRVQLMTIHKSKGLQFDTVILPALERGAPSDDKELLAWHLELGDDYDPRLLLAPIHASGGNDPGFEFVRKREQRRRSYETQRQLYVAITRAKNRLHLFASLGTNRDGEPAKPKAGSFLSLLYSHIDHYFLDAPVTGKQASSADTLTASEIPLLRVPADWRPVITGSNVQSQAADNQFIERERIEFSWAGQTARLVGTVVHQYLHRMGEEGIEQWDETRIFKAKAAIQTCLVSAGLPADALDTATSKVIHSLSNVLQSDKALWMLGPHEQAASELAMSGVIDGRIVNRIIDRTFIDEEGTRWIIDFKTSAHEGGNLQGFLDQEQERYQPQLNEYAQMMGGLEQQPQVIRAGLYFPLMDAWRELDIMGSVCLM
jgi:ATP-dependent exoDNAse (exonuclease V) beta subunit